MIVLIIRKLIVLVFFGTGVAVAQDAPVRSSPLLANPTLPEAVSAGDAPTGSFEVLTGEGGGESAREEEGEEIETDRDSFTPAVTLAPRRRMILETAYTFIDNRGFKETHSLPEFILRYGFSDRIELRFGCNYEVGGKGSEVSGLGLSSVEEFEGERQSTLERATSISYGAKLRVTRQKGWIPGSAAIIQAATPVSGEGNTTLLTVSYVAGWDLPRRWKFDSGLRYQMASEEGDRFGVWAPSTVLKFPFGEKWLGHVEYFGVISVDKAENFSRHYFSTGVHYLLTRNLEIGTRVGWGLNSDAERFFVNTGIGWQY